MIRIGLEEYANNLFLVHDGDGGGLAIFEDPGDAICEAEELAKQEGRLWYVTALKSADEPQVHIARPRTKTRSKVEAAAKKLHAHFRKNGQLRSR